MALRVINLIRRYIKLKVGNLEPLWLVLRKGRRDWLRKLIEQATLQNDLWRLFIENRGNRTTEYQPSILSFCVHIGSPSTFTAELANDSISRRRITISVALEQALGVLDLDNRLVNKVHDRASSRALATTIRTVGLARWFIVVDEVGRTTSKPRIAWASRGS